MNKKINVKLTLFMVSLFLGLIIIILGNKNKYCLSFGFVLSGIALIFYIWYKNEQSKQFVKDVNAQIQAMKVETDEDQFVLNELNALRKKVKKQNIATRLFFGLTAVLLIVLGVASLF